MSTHILERRPRVGERLIYKSTQGMQPYIVTSVDGNIAHMRHAENGSTTCIIWWFKEGLNTLLFHTAAFPNESEAER